MKKEILFVLALVIVLVAAQADSDSLWNKYRHVIISSLSNDFCKGQSNCQELDNTLFQFVDEPTSALWYLSRMHLNEDICRFVPAWKPNFTPRCASIDCTLPRVYENTLIKFPNTTEGAKNYMQFKKYAPEKFPKLSRKQLRLE